MNWEICYSHRAKKFIQKHKIEDEIRNTIKKFILKYEGEDINIDVKKLKGKWKGYYRIRIGETRIILKVEQEFNRIIIDTIDFREGIY